MKKLLLALVLSVFLLTSCANQPSFSDDIGTAAATSETTSKESDTEPMAFSPESSGKNTASDTAQTLSGMFHTQEELLGIIKNEPKLEDVQKLYPGKTVLTWVYGGLGKVNPGKSTVMEINEYLDSLGCEFNEKNITIYISFNARPGRVLFCGGIW